MNNKRLVVILGYYHRHNLGDDVYHSVFEFIQRRYAKTHEFLLVNPDDTNELPINTSCVIVGGGELLNNYYIPKINRLCAGYLVYGISIGVPYPKIINRDFLGIFDYIVTRNQEDVPLLKEAMGDKYVSYMPDLATILPIDEKPPCGHDEILSKYGLTKYGKRVGVFLARSCYSKLENGEAYKRVLTKLAQLLSSIAQSTIGCINNDITVYLFAFNTSESIGESDILLNADIKTLIPDDVTVINKTIEIQDIIPLFQRLHVALCSRFHAHVFSMMAGTPLVSLSSTRKVDSLLNAHGFTGFKYIVDPATLRPIDVPDINAIRDAVLKATKKTVEFKSQDLLYTLDNLLNYLPKRAKPTMDIPVQRVFKRICDYLQLNDKRLLERGGILKVCQELDLVNKSTGDTLTELIIFTLLGKVKSKYNWGLAEQILTPNYHLASSIEWILKDAGLPLPNLLNPIPWCRRKFNLEYMDNHYPDVHRSGWGYVMRSIQQLHNPEGIVLDTYLDQTYGWLRSFYAKAGVIPVKREWMGFLHHTPETSYTTYNLVTYFSDPLFIQSLATCKGLFVFSTYLKDWISARTNVPVYRLFHPTETKVPSFNWKAFECNQNKLAIHVGAWLRDTFSMYRLPKLKHLNKAILVGKAMENYYVFDDDWFTSGLVTDPQIMSRGVHKNKFLVGLQKFLQEKNDEIQILTHLDNNAYDTLLTQNVVFIKLVDASAVNTVVECLARSTPIVINRLPAVEEYLGKDYPLFYDTYEQATDLLNDMNKIKRAHKYLQKLDKNFIKIGFFMKSLLDISKTI